MDHSRSHRSNTSANCSTSSFQGRSATQRQFGGSTTSARGQPAQLGGALLNGSGQVPKRQANGCRASLALTCAILCSIFVLVVSVQSFLAQLEFFSNELMKQMQRRQNFFGPSVESQFLQLAVVPVNILASVQSYLHIAASSPAPFVEPIGANFSKGTAFLSAMLATHYYFQPVVSVSAISIQTGLVMTLVPGDLFVNIARPTVNATTNLTSFRQQQYYFTPTLTLFPPSGPSTYPPDRRTNDSEVAEIIAAPKPLTQYGRIRVNASYSYKTAARIVPILRKIDIPGVPPFILRAEYPTSYLTSAWLTPSGTEPRQALFDLGCNIIASNVPKWAGTCDTIPAPLVSAVIRDFSAAWKYDGHAGAAKKLNGLDGRTAEFYYTIRRIDLDVNVTGGNWYLLESSFTPLSPWSHEAERNGRFVGVLLACMVVSGLAYYLFSRAIFGSLIRLASVLEKTATRHRVWSAAERHASTARETDRLLANDSDEGTASDHASSCLPRLSPDFWGVRQAHARIEAHVDEVLSFVPQKALMQGGLSAAVPGESATILPDIVSQVQAPTAATTAESTTSGQAMETVLPVLPADQPIEMLQRARTVTNDDEIGQLLRCRMSALHVQVVAPEACSWTDLHTIMQIAVRVTLVHGGVVEGVEYGIVASTFNCHSPSSEHETQAVEAALSIERQVRLLFPCVLVVCVVDSDLAASVALGDHKLRVQTVLGSSLEVSRKLSSLDMPSCGLPIMATGTVVPNIRLKTIVMDCVQLKFGLVHFSSHARFVTTSNNGGRLVHQVTASPRTDQMMPAMFRLGQAFHDMLEGHYKSAVDSLQSLQGDPELAAHVSRLIALSAYAVSTAVGPRPAPYVRHELIPWEIWQPEYEDMDEPGWRDEDAASGIPMMPSILATDLDGLSDPRGGVSEEDESAAGAGGKNDESAPDPPLICSMSQLSRCSSESISPQ